MKHHTRRLLFHGLEDAALAHPDKPVAIIEGTAYSYGQLEQDANKLATALLARGVKRGDRIGVYLDNSWPCIVSIFSILKIGCVFLVINHQTKQDKLAFIIEDSDAVILITDTSLKAQFLPILTSLDKLKHVIYSGEEITLDQTPPQSLEGFDQALRQADETFQLAWPIIPTDLCSLIYTSGSTGNPKGVMHTHQSMVFAAQSLIEYLRLNSEDRILNVLPFAFDYGLYQLLMTCWLGATIVLERSFTYMAQVLNRIQELEVTVFPGVPTMYSMLVAAHKRKPLSMESVLRITNTAAALPEHYIPALQEIFPNALIFKMYGLTECKRVAYLEPELVDTHARSVGKAIPGTEVFLLDENDHPVPPGGEGILHIRGPHIMLGYWKRPDLSAKMLKEHHLPGEKILCSGDYFSIDENGFLYFKGRSDDIIKSRGEKVSPVEVENALYSIPGIKEAAVIGVFDETLDQAIRAYVAIEEDSDLTDRKIKQICTTKLENFMVPKEVIILDSLPKTATGKISKKGLGD